MTLKARVSKLAYSLENPEDEGVDVHLRLGWRFGVGGVWMSWSASALYVPLHFLEVFIMSASLVFH